MSYLCDRTILISLRSNDYFALASRYRIARPLRSQCGCYVCSLCWILSSAFSSITPASYAGIVPSCCPLLAAIPASSLLRILPIDNRHSFVHCVQIGFGHFSQKNPPFLAYIIFLLYFCTRKGFKTLHGHIEIIAFAICLLTLKCRKFH